MSTVITIAIPAIPATARRRTRGTDAGFATSAYTLVELLVSISVIGVLASLLMPAVARSQGASVRIHCLNNLRQLGLAAQLYADAHNDRLPDTSDGKKAGLWPWDIDVRVCDEFAGYGAVRQTFYCPGFPQQNNDFLWQFPGTYRVIGYVHTFPNASLLYETNINRTLSPAGPGEDPTRRVLLADATFCDKDGDFTRLQGQWSRWHRTSHLEGTRPAGGNVVAMDLHGEWRPFKTMTARTETPRFFF